MLVMEMSIEVFVSDATIVPDDNLDVMMYEVNAKELMDLGKSIENLNNTKDSIDYCIEYLNDRIEQLKMSIVETLSDGERLETIKTNSFREIKKAFDETIACREKQQVL